MLQEKEKKIEQTGGLGNAGGGQGTSHERVRFKRGHEGGEEVTPIGRDSGFPERKKSQSRTPRQDMCPLCLRNS